MRAPVPLWLIPIMAESEVPSIRGPRDRRRSGRERVRLLLDILYTILRFIARHVSGFWGALAAFLTFAVAVAVAAGAVFAGMAHLVSKGMTQSFDESVLSSLAAMRTPLLDAAMLEITMLGTGSVILLTIGTVSLFLWLTNHKWSMSLLLISVISGQIVNQALKQIFARPRPSIVDWGVEVSTLSFPSGHAMTSTIAFSCIAYLVGRLSPTAAMRNSVYGIAALIILAIAFSRMYLGVHYPSDVIAGIVAGLGWLAFVAATLTAVGFFAKRRPETHTEEEDLQASS